MAGKELHVAAAYHLHVSPTTKVIHASYIKWLNDMLEGLEAQGYSVSNALRDNDFRIEDDPVAAHAYDISRVKSCDIFMAALDEISSRSVQTGIGRAEMLGKPIVLAHTGGMALDAFNRSLVEAGVAHEITMPIDYDQLDRILSL